MFVAFVVGMACLVGMDFGVKFMASFVKCFEDEYHKEDNLSLRNIAFLLSYLCIFEVCSSDLVFDFLVMLSKRLTEDTSNKLKASSKDVPEKNNSKRLEFTFETIYDIKNNKKKSSKTVGIPLSFFN